MYHFIQAIATTAGLLTVVSGSAYTFIPENPHLSILVPRSSQYLRQYPDSNQLLAQETEPENEPTDTETPTPEATPDSSETPTPVTPVDEVEPTPDSSETPTPEATPDSSETPTPEEPSMPVESSTEEEMPAEDPAEATELILDAEGELVDGDQVLESDNSLYDEYTFDGEEGQSITVTLDSSDFDTYLAVFTPDDKLLEEHDDVSQTNSNSAITVTLPTTGIYRVIVNSYDAKGRGTYNLKIR
ncbi:MAG: pre-peptidase C-terminal domain-containing protein [Microcoleaceae cyanobacterium]